MKSNTRLVHNSTAAAIAIVLAAAAPMGQAEADDDEEIPFDEAELFFELNDTDGDLGIHSKIDGDAWKRLVIEDLRERRMLKVYVQGRLRKQGLTEFFFESAEPPFESDDPEEVTLTPEEFFARFPEGEYEIEGKTLDGEELESEVQLTHLMPAPPVVRVNEEDSAEDCDAEELPSFEEGESIIISWNEVTHSHPEIGKTNEPIEVVNYEVVVEIDETPYQSSTILPPNVTEFQVPQAILDVAAEEAEGEVKYEVLVREESYNQTAVESCFEIE